MTALGAAPGAGAPGGLGWTFRRVLPAAAVAGLFLALAGAFGTGQAPLFVRLTYWLGMMLGGTFTAVMTGEWLGRALKVDRCAWQWGVSLTATLVPPFSVVVWLVSDLVFFGRVLPERLAGYAVAVLAITGAMTAISMLTTRALAPPGEAAPAVPAPNPFLARLPPALRGAKLWAVESQDHYLQVHTSAGRELILMRLSDALAELSGLEGMQTHRSWWVARDAVQAVQRRDGRAVLTLEGGLQVPVSRAHAPALRQAGWL